MVTVNWTDPKLRHCIALITTFDGRPERHYPSGRVERLTVDNSSSSISQTPAHIGSGRYSSEFSGINTNDRIDLGSITSADPISFFSKTDVAMVARCNYADPNSNFPRFIDKSNGGTASGGWYWCVRIDGVDRDLAFVIEGDFNTAGATSPVITSFPVRTMALNVLNVPLSGTSTVTINGFVNGKSSMTDTFTSGPFPSTTTPAAVGNWNTGTDRQWKGNIEYVALFDKPLSDAEHRAFDRDGYSFFGSRQLVYSVGSSAAGTTHEVAITLPVDVGQSPGALANFSPTAALAASLTASPATIAGFESSGNFGVELADAPSAVAVLERAVSLGASLAVQSVSVVSIEGGATFAVEAGLAAQSTATFDATRALDLQVAAANATTADFETNTGLAVELSAALSTGSNFDAAATVGVALSDSPATQADYAAAIELQIDLGAIESADAELFGTLGLALEVDLEANGGAVVEETIALAMAAGLVSQSIITIEGAVVLSAQMALAESVVAAIEGATPLGLALEISDSVIAELNAAATLGFASGETLTAGATTDAGTAISVVLAQAATGTTAEVVITTPANRTLVIRADDRILSIKAAD